MQSLQVDLQTNLITITPNPNMEFDLATIPKRIRETGFTPDVMRIAARGTVERDGESLRFRILHWRRTMPVVGLASGATRVDDIRVEYAGGSLRLVADG